MSLKELYAERAKHEKRARELTKQIHEAKRRKFLTCEKCKRRTRIDKLVYRQTRWYERPYGCTDGDRWHDGEGQWDCIKCGHRHRLILWEGLKRKTHPTVYLKQYFGEIKVVHD